MKLGIANMTKNGQEKRATLTSVAKHAGLDPSTVSRVLTGDTNQRISDETKARILNSAEILNYRPNTLARKLRTSRSKSICIVLPRFDQTVFTKMMEGVFAACTVRDYFPYIVVTPKESSTSEILKKLEQLECTNCVAQSKHVSKLDAVFGPAFPLMMLHELWST